MPKYQVDWEAYGWGEVEAESEEEAKSKIESRVVNKSGMGISVDGVSTDVVREK